MHVNVVVRKDCFPQEFCYQVICLNVVINRDAFWGRSWLSDGCLHDILLTLGS